MENPFKPDEKVLTKIKGIEVEVTVRLTFNSEVQVKCPDGSLRWRTAKTVWRPTVPADAPLSAPEPAPVVEATAPAESIAPAEEPTPSVDTTTASNEPNATASEVGSKPDNARKLIACSGEVGTKQPKGKRKKRK